MKYSLNIGINIYPDTDENLDGCVNDANDWARELENRGFEATKLIDSKATKEAIIGHIKELVAKAKRGDIVVITYSGHGTWVEDENGDEADGRDEALCPYDVAKGNIIIDDELHNIFINRNWGAKIIFISDSCHSGSVNMAPNMLNRKVAKIRFLEPKVYLRGDKEIVKKLKSIKKAKAKMKSTSLLLTACKDMEYSYDTYFRGRANGAFTHTAIKCLKSLKKDATYQDWYRKIREHLPSSSYPQTPQIVATNYQKYRWRVFNA